ncbi:hypothetical protein RhiLY_02630 [Ceratobasidium sp. AG-Ba]|nr:hypothetical protein RhiLY_02630 [Ceratobasidium sp. AG-Ba]
MSTSSQSEVHSIVETLRALLNSFAPDGQASLPKDADVSKLAEKLDEILASKGGLVGVQAGISRDEQGRPLNEEGLPIMDIVEAVNDDSAADLLPASGAPLQSSVSEQAPLSPLPNWALSPTALAARRRERDRILDLLEREEEEEFAREAIAARTDIPAPQVASKSPRTLNQIVRPPVDVSRPSTLPAALTNVSMPPEDAAKPISPPANAGILNTGSVRRPKKQKSVSFVDHLPSDHSNDQSHAIGLGIDWGDVVPVPFNPRNSRKPGPSIMKDLVVERGSNQRITHAPGRIVDSDDEDYPGEDENDVSQDDESDSEVPLEALRPSEASEEDDKDGEEEDFVASVDETDFDEAMLQREIALAYYARRNQIGADVISGPLFDSTTTNQMTNDGDRGAATPDTDDKPNGTRFRRSRLTGDSQALINSAVQFGKLVEGQLVAEEVADQDVEASLNELTGGSNTNNEEDMTEKTIARLMYGENAPQDEPGGTLIPSKHAQVPALSDPSTISARLGSITPPRSKIAPEHKSLSKSQPAPVVSSSRKPKLTQQTASVPVEFPPMIIESGYGFDPAFQIAPKAKVPAAKPIAPMSETVKERPSTSINEISARGRGKSRFAQAPTTEELKSQPISTTLNAGTLSTNVIERAAPTTRVQPPEPSKRISRFRAERAGYL